MDSISKLVSVERDAAYMVGFDKGKEKSRVNFVKNLLAKTLLPIDQVAAIAGVSVGFVLDIKKNLFANK